VYNYERGRGGGKKKEMSKKRENHQNGRPRRNRNLTAHPKARESGGRGETLWGNFCPTTQKSQVKIFGGGGRGESEEGQLSFCR